MLQTVGPAVKALYSLYTGTATSCLEADDEDGCKEALCPIIAGAGCCLTTLDAFFDTGNKLHTFFEFDK